jgi:hypothetical protein
MQSMMQDASGQQAKDVKPISAFIQYLAQRVSTHQQIDLANLSHVL